MPDFATRTLPDCRADGAVRHVAVSSREVTICRRYRGIAMRLVVPCASYRGIGLKQVGTGAEIRHAITLLHTDPDFDIVLSHEADQLSADLELAEWTRLLGLPTLLPALATFNLTAAAKRPLARRRSTTLLARRRRNFLRRKSALVATVVSR